MKLFCIKSCIVKGGKVVEAGQHHETGVENKKEDKEAFELIAAGCMIEARDPEVAEHKARIDDENAVKAAREEERVAALPPAEKAALAKKAAKHAKAK